MKYKRGDVLVGTKAAGERYAITVENSVIIFLTNDFAQGRFIGLYVGNLTDVGIDSRIEYYVNYVRSTYLQESFGLSQYTLMYEINDEKAFVPLNRTIQISKKIPKRRLPTL